MIFSDATKVDPAIKYFYTSSRRKTSDDVNSIFFDYAKILFLFRRVLIHDCVNKFIY